MFVAKNQVHYFQQNVDYHGLLIDFNESFLVSSDTDINFFLTYHVFNNKERPYFQIPRTLIKSINEYSKQITVELNNENEFGNSSILSNLLKSLLLVVEGEIRKESGDPKINGPNLAHLKFRNLLEANFKKGWSVGEYANGLDISIKTLNSIIKKETGTTVSHVIQDRILFGGKKATHSYQSSHQRNRI